MKVIFRLILLLLVMFGLVHGYLWWMRHQVAQRSDRSSNIGVIPAQYSSNQDGEVSLEGVLKMADGRYYLELLDKSTIDLASFQLALNSFLDKKVIISGEYNNGKVSVNKVQEI